MVDDDDRALAGPAVILDALELDAVDEPQERGGDRLGDGPRQ